MALLAGIALRSTLRVQLARALSTATPATPAAPAAAPIWTDEEAVARYVASPQSFKALPIDQFHFAPVAGEGKVSPIPKLFFSGRTQPGVLHISPFARAMFPHVGPHGNLGQPKVFSVGNVEDPAEAKMIVNVGIDYFPDGQPNDLMVEYLTWIQSLEALLLKHLTEAHQEYPVLAKKFGKMIEHADTRSDLLATILNPTVKVTKGSDKYPSTPFLPLRQSVYTKATLERLARYRPLTEIDATMATRGYARRPLPIYNVNGEDLGIDAVIKANDIISIHYDLDGVLYDVAGNVGFGLRKNIRGIVFLRNYARKSADSAFPL